ncbi:hypothetical protein AJ78_05214 [Emergomyces pasteurianus Ep9510]|uniref:Uncharacterized protein n=1 Tax=Emergomyces pasteurianus Ep9510 TaxID=1447872 RepID=A0A1J9PEJ8_9EURO|nr:hypothetical protein AJ78_05214 [Emergomyces pasteurianus Ep9510]
MVPLSVFKWKNKKWWKGPENWRARIWRSCLKAMDILGIPPQVHLMQDGQIAKITCPVRQMGCPEMPLYSIIVGSMSWGIGSMRMFALQSGYVPGQRYVHSPTTQSAAHRASHFERAERKLHRHCRTVQSASVVLEGARPPESRNIVFQQQ